MPVETGLVDGRLAPCPSSPNCVISIHGDQHHHIEPIIYTGETKVAMETMLRVVQGISGSRIITHAPPTMHVGFRSRWMGFVDDMVFYFLDTPVIHVRSAARVGYTDFGVNRKRVEKISVLFHQRLQEDRGE